jgi:hypothetical protein
LAAFFPTGLIVFTLLVSREPYIARAVAFLVGALLMTFVAGVVFISVLHGADAAGTSSSGHVSGGVDIALGCLLLAAFWVARRRPAKQREDGPAEQKGWIVKLMRSPTLALVLGAAMYAPSPIYIAALKTVADAGLSTAGDFIWIVVLTVIVTSMIEIPVVLLLRNPERGRAVLAGLNGWMSRNGRRVGLWALFAAAVYLIARGLVRVT